MATKYIKVSAKDIFVYPTFTKENAVSKEGKPYIKNVEQVVTADNAIRSHCVANMLTAFLGLRPVKKNDSSVLYGEGNSFCSLRTSIDKQNDWILALADECLYSIDSTIIKEVQTGHKPHYTRNTGIPKMRWIDALNTLKGDKVKFFQMLKKFEELTGVRPETDKMDFETYADLYLRGKVDYKTALLDSEWAQTVFDSGKESFTFLVNQLDKKVAYNDSHRGDCGNKEIFDGRYGVNDIIGVPTQHYTFDVSFYIPVNKAEELLNENRSTIDSNDSFVDLLKNKLSVFYLGSPAVFKTASATLDDIDVRFVKNGELYD